MSAKAVMVGVFTTLFVLAALFVVVTYEIGKFVEDVMQPYDSDEDY